MVDSDKPRDVGQRPKNYHLVLRGNVMTPLWHWAVGSWTDSTPYMCVDDAKRAAELAGHTLERP